MGRTKSAIIGACVAVTLAAAAVAAQGIPADRSTFVTVSGPVSLPGVTLPAGTYLFRLADTQASRNVVQIFDRDRTKIFATLIAISAERSEPSDEAVITFKETPSDRPPAVRYWYFAGEKAGQEFAYPKAQAQVIASASGESVLAVDATAADMNAMKSAEITRVEPGAATASSEASPAQQPAAQPEQAPAQSAPATATPEPTPQAETPQPAPRAAEPRMTPAPAPSADMQPTGTSGRTNATPSRELPRTASTLPLVGLFGFVALGAAFVADRLRRRLMV